MLRFFKRRKSGPTCDEVLAALQSYLDGELDAATASAFAAHIDVCDMCGPEAALFTKIKDSLQLRAEPVDPQVLANLEAFGRNLAAGSNEP